MMNNKDKQYVSGLEARVYRLEKTFEGMVNEIKFNANNQYSCSQCGAYNPRDTGYQCSMPDCCQGLNPEDDNPKQTG